MNEKYVTGIQTNIFRVNPAPFGDVEKVILKQWGYDDFVGADLCVRPILFVRQIKG